MKKYVSLKRLFSTALLLLCSNSVFAVGNPSVAVLPSSADYQYVFDINALPEISIEISPAQWNVLLSSTKLVRPKAQITSFTFTKNGISETVTNIGVKMSGNTSFVNPETGTSHCVNCADWVQANFNFDFTAFVGTQTFRGLSGLKIKRFRDDPTYIREIVANDIMQKFGIFTVHSSTYARVYIHVTGDNQRAYFGVYRMNEDVNELEYLTSRFGVDNDAGQLWKMSYSTVPNCSGPADLTPIPVDSNKMSRDDCTYEFKGKKAVFAAAKTSFVAFLEAINSKSGADFKLYAEEKINTELLLKGMAAEAVLGQWDGMSTHFNNYYLYFDEAGVMQFIPFDMDNTLGTSSAVIGDSGTANLLTWGKNILALKMLSIPEYKAQYVAYLNELVNNSELMVEGRTVSWIKARQNLVKNVLVNDTGDNGTFKDSPSSWGNRPNYRIFDLAAGTNWYATKKAAVTAATAESAGFSKSFNQLFFRGTPNAWKTTPMELVGNNTWQLQVSFGAADNQRFKVDVSGDWSNNYGDNNADKTLDKSGADIKVNSNTTYLITVNDLTRKYSFVDVSQANIPPVANAGPDKIALVGSMVRFDGSASTDVDGTIFSYLWSNGIINPSDDVVYPEVGQFLETLTVTDDDGATATDTVLVTIVDNFAPLANAGADLAVQVGQPVTLNGSASSDSNGNIVSYEWSNGLSGATAVTSFAIPGVYTITLTVTDNQGATATDTVTITVNPAVVNTPPVANAGADITVVQDQLITFNGAGSSDSDGTIVSYSWSNGLTGKNPTATISTVGTFTITLTVTDDKGATATDSVIVKVNAKPAGVNVTFTCNNATTVSGQSVYAVGSVAQLGSWATSKAIKLSASSSSVWKGVINLPASTAVQWKCIKINGSAVVWEPGANTAFTTPATGTATTTGSF
ncbi:MAG TPA: PKD domain-containing protein [Cellvibrio sp.]|nr:PKD domain-containing protein [Cellvibrio sp.]